MPRFAGPQYGNSLPRALRDNSPLRPNSITLSRSQTWSQTWFRPGFWQVRASLRPARDFFWVESTPWVKKRCHPNHGYNFVNSWWICKILSLLQTAVNFQQNPYWVTHHTLSMLLHYLGKLKNQKFALCMHVKHVSSVIWMLCDFFCPTDICQMSWKLVQRLTLCKISTFYFLFVYCP